MIVQELAAAKTYVEPNVETRERFKIAAAKRNARKRVKHEVTWKSVQKRYKWFEERFEKNEDIELIISGLGCDVG